MCLRGAVVCVVCVSVGVCVCRGVCLCLCGCVCLCVFGLFYNVV